MVNDITVSLMNAPSVIVNGEKKVFPYRKVEGLFYYICVRKRITRDEAIGIFWVDCDETNARKNLRDALYHIKKIVGPDLIQLEGNTFISLNQAAPIHVDVDEALTNILENYKGEFLSYFYVKNCLEFENWMEDYRRELKEIYIRAAEHQTEAAIREKRTAEAVRYAGKLVDVYYLDENFYRKVISYLMEAGEYSAAVSLYQKLVFALKHDLDEEPEAETRELMERILALRKKITVHTEKGQTQFTGRRSELYGIYDMIQKHRVRGAMDLGNFVLVSGEAGVGKTALMDQLRTLLGERDYAVFSYSCCPSETDLYLKAWNDLLRQIRDFTDRQKKELGTAGTFFISEARDYRVFATQYETHFEELLRSFCREFHGQELVFFLDDIQWMDPSSIQLLNNILFHLKDCPIFVVAASRLEQVQELESLKVSLMRESLIRQIDLKRFTLEETKELIGACSAELLKSQEKVEQIYHYTEGNALFLTEFLRTLRDSDGELESGRKMTSRMVSIIQSRLMKLTKEQQELLTMMSVFYHEVSIEDIQILYQEPEMKIYGVLEGLLSHQIIDEKVDGTAITYSFTHILIHNYVQSKISAGRKQIYYRRIAEYYEEKYKQTGNIGLMPELIYFFENAGDPYKKYTYKLEYFKAFFSGKEEIYPVMSASFSDKFFYPDLNSGENILLPLAEEIRALPQKDHRYQELRMKVEYLMGRYDLSSGDYAKGLRNMNACIEAAKLLDNPRYLLDSYLQMIFYAIQVYDLDMMNEYIAYCSQLLEEYAYPASDAYPVRRLHALYYIKTQQFGKAQELLEPMIPELERLHASDPSYTAGLAACYNYQGEIFMKQEAWEEALTCISKAVACSLLIPPMAGLGVAYTNMGIILYRLERYDKASGYLEKARECFQNLSIQWGRSKEEAYSALLDIKLGKESSALTHYQMACRYTDKDYSPNTMFMLQDIYQQLREIPGLDPREPPKVPESSRKR